MSAQPDPNKLKPQYEPVRGRFLKTELELGFTFARLAATKYDIGHVESAEESRASAEKVYQTVNRFLLDPKQTGAIPSDEVQELRTELQRFRERLDGLGP